MTGSTASALQSPQTQTVTPAPTVATTPTPAPVQVQTVVATPIQANPTLLTQLGHVDPLVWTALVGTLVVPLVHQLIKRFVSSLHDPKHRTTNYAIAGLLSVVVGVLTDLQNSGALTKLHNPLLATILSASLAFLLSQQVYGFFVKTNEQANAVASLPVATDL